ncbi:alpha-galactosidase [Terribacillus halophilus]|uniref:Alpha-galactosidase n=1 Tax=Terribacillus halophilus TaxID=361279 RepID=A0A1G6WWM3_9BACI|nr:alpha-glucosidase/alpha-galactosidase [Terribacillus halophilus]SDD69476.1 alpha-galactosidase [Terribacillus halophilus]
MSFKIAFVGAGSIGFTRALLRDILTVPAFKDIDIAFTDIDADNLSMVTDLCQRDIRENGLSIAIQSTLDRREALKDARYIISVFRIGGLEAFEQDINIPLRYGVDQCVGDTLSAGGIMYGQRGIHEMLEVCKDIREVAEPDCLLLNYANPMAMLTWACNTHGGVKTVGLCHGVQGGHRQIADVLGLEQKDLDIICAGINHQTWYIQVSHKGEDLTGKLLQAFEAHPEYSKTEKVRIDMLRRFGYYSTESNGHLSEYVPWYRKRLDEITDWIDLGTWINGETGGYLRVCTEGRNWFKEDFPNWMKEPAYQYVETERGQEHGSYIIEALETGRTYRGHFNTINKGIIHNLPQDAIIEAPGYVDRNGISMPVVGDLPLGCAAVCQASISVQRLAVEAAITGDDRLLRQAFMMDPLVGAVCTPPEIWQMVDDMLIAQEQWLPQYKESIVSAKKRQQTEERLPLKEYTGAARLKIKSVEEMQTNRQEASKNAREADKALERPAQT